MKLTPILATAAAAAVVLPTAAFAASHFDRFAPLPGSAYGQESTTWTEPFVVADGFRQQLLTDETTLDIYPGVDDLTDMNVSNETGRDKGRYLYRTHEVGTNGAVSVVDLKTGAAKVIAQDLGYRRLDGIEWTPWGTVLFAEETTGGRVFEMFLDKKDPSKAVKVVARPKLGIIRHEGIGVGPSGEVYVIDELNGGSIFKFVPTRKGDLSDGQLYALKINALAEVDQNWSSATYQNKVGAFTWVALDMAIATVDAKAAADAVNATEFGRPEDVDLIGHKLYVANTSEDRVVQIDLKTMVLTSFISAGVNAGIENIGGAVTGFNAPDNLAVTPGGKLMVVEDNDYSDIWVAGGDRNNDGAADSVSLFASMVDIGGEGSGIYFGKDNDTLFVNVQHPDKAQADGTWMITRES